MPSGQAAEPTLFRPERPLHDNATILRRKAIAVVRVIGHITLGRQYISCTDPFSSTSSSSLKVMPDYVHLDCTHLAEVFRPVFDHFEAL